MKCIQSDSVRMSSILYYAIRLRVLLYDMCVHTYMYMYL